MNKKTTIRVWFNHWFSTAYHIVNLLKNDSDIHFYVISTSENPDSVIKKVCDEWYLEPHFTSDDDYVEYCLHFCREHHIEVFVPRRRLRAVCRHMRSFQEAGVRVLTDSDYAKIECLNDKWQTYRLFERIAPECVPEVRLASSLEAFEAIYFELSSRYERICFKLASDEGAASFRVIDNKYNFESIYSNPGQKVSYDAALKILARGRMSHPVIVMPYLRGEEVSVDCLCTAYGNIIIPRYKTVGRMEVIRFNPEIIGLCQRFIDHYRLETPFNMQFKYDAGTPYLLEINTRMSGGLQLSCAATGVNIPNLAVNRLCGIDKPWSCDRRERKVSFIETPILFEENNELPL